MKDSHVEYWVGSKVITHYGLDGHWNIKPSVVKISLKDLHIYLM